MLHPDSTFIQDGPLFLLHKAGKRAGPWIEQVPSPSTIAAKSGPAFATSRPIVVAAVPDQPSLRRRGCCEGPVAIRGHGDVGPRVRRRGAVRRHRDLDPSGADPDARLRDAADQCAPRAHGGVAVAEGPDVADPEVPRLLLPHRRGLGLVRAPRDGSPGDRRLLGRHGHRAVGELDVVLGARRLPRLVPRRSRAASARISPSRPCSSASSPASAAAA